MIKKGLVNDNGRGDSTATLPSAVINFDCTGSKPDAGNGFGLLSRSDKRWEEHSHR